MGLSSDKTDKTEGLAQKNWAKFVFSVSSDDLKPTIRQPRRPLCHPVFARRLCLVRQDLLARRPLRP